MGGSNRKVEVNKCDLCSSYYKHVRSIFAHLSDFHNEIVLSAFQNKHQFICVDCKIQLSLDVIFYISAFTLSMSQVRIDMFCPDSKLGIMMRDCAFPYSLCCAVMMKDLEMIEMLVTMFTEGRVTYWDQEAIPNNAKFSILHYACTEFQNYKEDIEQAFQFLPEDQRDNSLEEIFEILRQRDNQNTRLKMLKFLLLMPSDMDVVDTYGMTCLAYLSKYTDLESMKLLISKGAKVTLSELLFPTSYAFEEGKDMSHPDLTTTFLECSTFDDFVHAACRLGNLEVATFLLTQVCPHHINYSDEHGSTPLHYAIRHNHLHIVKYLLSLKCQVTIQNNKGETPLHTAFKNGTTLVIMQLLKAVTNSEDEDLEIQAQVLPSLFLVQDFQGNSPLHYVVSFSQRLNIFEFLIDHEVDVTIKDRSGSSPLDIQDLMGNDLITAAMKANMYTLCHKAFLKGVHPVKNKSGGISPLQYAIRKVNLKMIKLCIFHLKMRGMVSLSVQVMSEPTSLTLSNSCQPLVLSSFTETLVQTNTSLMQPRLFNPSISLTDKLSLKIPSEARGESPPENELELNITPELEFLIKENYYEILETLIFSGVFDFFTSDIKNWCPINFAVQQGNLQILLLLLETYAPYFTLAEAKAKSLLETAKKNGRRNISALLQMYIEPKSTPKQYATSQRRQPASRQRQLPRLYQSNECSEFSEGLTDKKYHETSKNRNVTTRYIESENTMTSQNEDAIYQNHLLRIPSPTGLETFEERLIQSDGTDQLWCDSPVSSNTGYNKAVDRRDSVHPASKTRRRHKDIETTANKGFQSEGFDVEATRNQIIHHHICYLEEEQEFFREFENYRLKECRKEHEKLRQRIICLSKEVCLVKKENELLKSRRKEVLECLVCMNATINAVLMPCRHLVTCETCATQLLSCPVCRESKEYFTLVYL